MRKICVFVLAVLLSGCHGPSVKKEDLLTANTPVRQLSSVKHVVGIGRIEPENEIISLATNAGGVIQKIQATEGKEVQVGEVLFNIENSVERARIAQIKGKLATQKEQIHVAETVLKQTQIQRDNRKSYYQRMKNLFESNATTKQDFENAEAAYLTQESKLESNQAELRLAKSRFSEIEKELQTAVTEADKKTVKATQKGCILELLIQEGSAIEALSPFARFAPDGKTIATCEIDELFATEVATGQYADIRLVGSEKVLSTGKVIYTSDYLRKKSLFSEKAGDQEDRRVREVKILLDKPNVCLFNTRVECAIKTH